MTVDVRAVVTCNLGPVVRLSISDSYPPAGGGIITTRGEIVLDTVSAPSTGANVEISWVNSAGQTKELPRVLRVISTSTDPLLRQTYVSVGCQLSFAQDHQALEEVEQEASVARGEFIPPPITWWRNILEVPSKAIKLVGDEAAVALNAGTTYPLAVASEPVIFEEYENPEDAEWEFSSTYLSTIGTFAASEGKFIAVSPIGVLYEATWGTDNAKYYDESSLVSLSPLGVGEVPASKYRVYFSYNSLQEEYLLLEAPTETCTETTGDELSRTVRYRTDSDLDDPDNEPTEDSFSYTYTPSSRTCVYRDEYGREYKVVETVEEYGLLDSYAALVASAGFAASAEATASAARTKITTTTREFDEADHVISETVEVTHDRNVMLGVLDLPYATPAYKDSTGETVAAVHRVTASRSGTFVVERIERTTGPEALDLRITTRRWVAYGYTPDGQQASAEQGRESVNAAVLNAIVTDGERLIEQPIEWQTIEGAASQWNEELKVAEYLGSVETDLGSFKKYKLAARPQRNYLDVNVTLAGVASDVTKVVSLPLAPDTLTITKTTKYYIDGTQETVVLPLSNPLAERWARSHLRCVQKVEYGMRYGLSLQVSADTIPAEHLFSVRLRIGGAVGAYVAAGVTWTADSTGIITSFDALYAGMAGGAGSPFGPVVSETFPPLPDVVIDPDLGPIVEGGDVELVPPYNTELPVQGGIGIGVAAYRLDYDVARTQTAELGIGVGVEAQVAP